MENIKENELKISIDENTAQGIYSNLAIISHSHSEFVTDFLRLVPGVKNPKVHARIIMAPEHAKRLMRALEDNIRKYESQNGEIVLPEDNPYNMINQVKGEA